MSSHRTSGDTADPFPHHAYDVEYSPLSRLNTLDVHLPEPCEEADLDAPSKHWIIYLHGGAWRDPAVTSRSVSAALPFLAHRRREIAGIASINYRLSSYPNHPSSPSSSDDSARNAVHPDHIEDVLTALTWLQQKYHFQEDYIIVGHSAGATLAFQAVMGTWQPRGLSGDGKAPKMAQPHAVVGCSGIYCLETLLQSYPNVPIYREFLESAFGKDRTQWRLASPVNSRLGTTWPNAKVVVLAQSKDDELVDFLQTEKMSDHLWKEKRSGRRDSVILLSGSHNSIWQGGSELSKAIVTALDMLKRATP